MVAGALFVFVLALGFWPYHACAAGLAPDTMLSAFIATRVQQQLDQAMAAMLVLLALTLIALFLASRGVSGSATPSAPSAMSSGQAWR